MADKTHIEWTDATWNPITGCSVVSPGCTNCYAMRLAGTRLKHHESRAGLTTDTRAGPVWTGEVRFNEQWLDQPLRWKKPRMIFVCAHGDLFHKSVPDAWIDKVFAVMALAPQHTFQIPTKRSARMREYLTAQSYRTPSLPDTICEQMAGLADCDIRIQGRIDYGWPLPNVWLGVSVEDQKRADERIPDLLATPAAVRWISAEPLLGPVSLVDQCNGHYFLNSLEGLRWHDAPDGVPTFKSVMPPGNPKLGDRAARLDWVVAGGESGNGARPMHPDWARSLRDQCATAGVAFHFKQWGNWWPRDQWEHNPELILPDDDYIASGNAPGTCEINGEVMHWLDKARAGRLLDGIEHNAFPRVAP